MSWLMGTGGGGAQSNTTRATLFGERKKRNNTRAILMVVQDETEAELTECRWSCDRLCVWCRGNPSVERGGVWMMKAEAGKDMGIDMEGESISLWSSRACAIDTRLDGGHCWVVGVGEGKEKKERWFDNRTSERDIRQHYAPRLQMDEEEEYDDGGKKGVGRKNSDLLEIGSTTGKTLSYRRRRRRRRRRHGCCSVGARTGQQVIKVCLWCRVCGC